MQQYWLELQATNSVLENFVEEVGKGNFMSRKVHLWINTCRGKGRRGEKRIRGEGKDRLQDSLERSQQSPWAEQTLFGLVPK